MSKATKRTKTRSKSKSSSTVPAFLLKTYEILEDPTYNDIACWNKEGNAFIVKNVTEFSDKILPKYFKHSNFASFVRQLNMYDFHKTRHENNENEFRHKLFKRGQKHLLGDIKRKIAEAQTESNQLVPVSREFDVDKFKKEAGHFSSELKALKGRQTELDKFSKTIFAQNTKLLKENKLLWGELIKNKEKYEKKIEKLMMFVFSVMQYSGNNAIESENNQKSIGNDSNILNTMGLELPESLTDFTSDTELMKADLADGDNKALALLSDKKDHEKFLKNLGKYFQSKGNKSNIDKLTEFAKKMGDSQAKPETKLGMTAERDSTDSSLPHENTRGRKNGRVKVPNPDDVSDDDFFQELPMKFVKLDAKEKPAKNQRQPRQFSNQTNLSLDSFTQAQAQDRSFDLNRFDSVAKESPLLPPSLDPYRYPSTGSQDFLESPKPILTMLKSESIPPFALLEGAPEMDLNTSREEPVSLLNFPQGNPDDFLNNKDDKEKGDLSFGFKNNLSFDENLGLFGSDTYKENREGFGFNQ